MEFPEGTNMKPPRGSNVPLEVLSGYTQSTQKRVPIKKNVLKGECQDAGISN